MKTIAGDMANPPTRGYWTLLGALAVGFLWGGLGSLGLLDRSDFVILALLCALLGLYLWAHLNSSVQRARFLADWPPTPRPASRPRWQRRDIMMGLSVATCSAVVTTAMATCGYTFGLWFGLYRQWMKDHEVSIPAARLGQLESLISALPWVLSAALVLCSALLIYEATRVDGADGRTSLYVSFVRWRRGPKTRRRARPATASQGPSEPATAESEDVPE